MEWIGKKKLVVGLIVLVLVAGGLITAWLLGLFGGGEAGATTTTTTMEAQAEKMTITDTVGASGTLEPAQRADLAFTASGKVASVNVAVGDKVTAGTALAAIDLTNLQAAVDEAQDALDAAEKDYSAALSSGTSTSQAAAKSNVTVKENALLNAQDALAEGTLTAPFDGTVAAVNVEVGDSVGGSSSTGNTGAGMGGSGSTSSSAAVTLITTTKYTIEVAVGATDVGKLAKGMTAAITPTSGDPLTGTVTGVGVIASSTSDSGAPAFPVEIEVDGEQETLYAGISATVQIQTAEREALGVPTQAIGTNDDGKLVVQKKTASGTVETVVTVGSATGGMTEITSGLEEGDTVVITVVTVVRASSSASATEGGWGGIGVGGFGGMDPGSGGQMPTDMGGMPTGMQQGGGNWSGGPGGARPSR